MIEVAEIIEYPNSEFVAACYSESWNKLNRNDVKKEIDGTKSIKVDGNFYEIKNFNVSVPFVGGHVVFFELRNSEKIPEIQFPAVGELVKQ
jgi:hypothetical protein